MLDLFRKRGVASVLYGGIITAIIVVFVIQFGPSAGQKTASLREDCVATVRGYCVTPKEHRAAFRLLIPRDPSGNLDVERAKSMGLQRIALDGLVERELLVGEADRLGIGVTDDEVTDAIFSGFIHVSLPSENTSLAASLRVPSGKLYAGFKDPKSKKFDYKVYERTIRNLLHRSPAEFKQNQTRELIAAKVRDVVRAPVRVSDEEALQAYVHERSSAVLEYVDVSDDYLSRYAVRVNDAAVTAWAAEEAHKKAIDDEVGQRKDGDMPKKGHIRHILVRSGPGDDKAAALGKLAEALGKIRAGTSFATVARKFSDDTGSAMQGGDVGDKTDGFVEPFKLAANALGPGEMTKGAIETQFGYHLIYKDADKAPEPKAFEAKLRQEVAREQYVAAKARETGDQLAKAIDAGWRTGEDMDKVIDKALKPLLVTQPPMAKIEVLPPPSARVAPAGDAGATQAAADAGAPESPDNEPEEKIEARVRNAEIDEERPRIRTTTPFNRGGVPIQEIVGADATHVMTFAFSAKEGDHMEAPVRTKNGAALIRLKERKAATEEDFDKERDTYVETLLAAKRAEALALYVTRLRERSKEEVKVDTKRFDESPAEGADDDGS